tara:strand:+ start:125 stop:430 length:306 start_codon:yes stop_codon:yes gene_type:complete
MKLLKYFNLQVSLDLLNAAVIALFLGYSVFATTMWTIHSCPSSTSLRSPSTPALQSAGDKALAASRELKISTAELQVQVNELMLLVDEHYVPDSANNLWYE